MNRYILLLCLGFFSASSIAAFPVSIDSDGDGVPDTLEFWLRAHGIAVSETVANVYTDTDSDGIPDLVEDNVSHTDKTVNESTVATAIAGFGLANNSGEIAGQWDICLHVTNTDISGDIGTPDECESVYTAVSYSGASILHSTTDQVKSFVSGAGYAVSESYNSGTNTYTASLSNTGDDGVVTTAAINAVFDGADGMSGTFDSAEDGVPNLQLRLTAVRRTSGWTGTGDPSGIYTSQDTTINPTTDFPVQRSAEFTPENFALQLSFSGSQVIVYDESGTTDPAGLFYIPALGVIAEGFAEFEIDDLDGDGATDDTDYEVGRGSVMVLALPTGNNSGLVRGVFEEQFYDDIDSNQPLTNGLPTGLLADTIVPGVGDFTGAEADHFYGRHHEPRVVIFTRNTTAGFLSHVGLNNVPLAASQISLSGPAGFSTIDVVNESGGTSMPDAVIIRNRANPESRPDGFVALQVGISSDDTHNVSHVHHVSSKTSSITSLFPSGTYTFSSGAAGTFNDPRNTASVSTSYTRPASTAALLDVPNPEPMTRQIGSGSIKVLNPGTPLNQFVLGSAKSNGGIGNTFDTSQSLTVTWPAVAGASKYVVRVECSKEPNSYCDDIDQFRRSTTDTSAQIPANTLDPFVAYRIRIEARDADGSIRSITTGTGINNTNVDGYFQTASLSEGPNVAGWSNPGSGFVFESLHRPGDSSGSGSGSGIGFILMHGRCGFAEGSVVSTLRRSIADDGYDTISIRLPANIPAAENVCESSTTTFSDFETGAAYVVTETIARVRQAMNLLKNNGAVNRVVLVGFSLGSRLASVAAAGSSHNTPTPLPVVGLVLAGTRSGSTSVTSLDTTTALGQMTVPILDLYMDEDFPAVSTAAARVAAYAGSPADYTQTVMAVNDSWGLVDGSTSNISNPRHKFLGYESVLKGAVSSWITTTDLSLPAAATSADIVIDFGGIGLWARMNDASWLKLNNASPDQVVVGDMDGNGEDDVIAVFGSGIFVKRNLGPWVQLHNASPDAMAVGDLDNNGKDDVVIDFGGIGLWARMNDTSWVKLNNASPTEVVVGDMDGNGQDDVIAVFSGGIFVKRNLGAWVQLHNFIPDGMAVGDLDNNGKDDVVIDFGSIGLWARMNDGSWLKLHNSSPDLIATGDVDGNGADDVLAAFGSSFGGLWQKVNLGGWSQLNANAPDEVISTDVDGSGQDDIIAKFGSTIGGVFVKRNQGAWVKLHNTSPESIAVGNLDGS